MRRESFVHLRPMKTHLLRRFTEDLNTNWVDSWSEEILAYHVLLLKSNLKLVTLLFLCSASRYETSSIILKYSGLLWYLAALQVVLIETTFINIFKISYDWADVFLRYILPEVSSSQNNPLNWRSKWQDKHIFSKLPLEIYFILIFVWPWIEVSEKVSICWLLHNKRIIRSNFCELGFKHGYLTSWRMTDKYSFYSGKSLSFSLELLLLADAEVVMKVLILWLCCDNWVRW